MAARSRRPASLPEIISGGDRRAALEAIRDKLATELDLDGGKDAATIAKELRAVIAELDSLPVVKEASKVADLTARIAARRQNTKAV